MSVPDAAVSYLLENIVQVLKYNYSLVADVGDNIKELQTELESLQGLMTDIARYNYDSDYLKILVTQIKSVIHDTEDAVDTYVVQTAVQKSKSWVNKAFHIVDYPKKLREVGKTIQEIRVKVRRYVDEARVIGVPLMLNQPERKLTESAKPKEDPKVEEEHVVGFEGAIKYVSQLLAGGSEQLEVISIVGMLGLGKTTLAKKVFNDREVDFEYMVRVFVYVSREYDRKEVFVRILRSLKDNSDFNHMSADDLESYLYKKLTGKQYLIVLDDIWEKEDWNNLKDAFPKNNKRCRVLITTRHEKLAEHAQNSDTPLYKLDFLTLEKSRELLCWKVFRHNSLPERMKDYELEIATKCAGLPLAIVVIAGILFNSRDRVDWWRSVAVSVADYIAREQQQTTKVIELMYTHLPNRLKECFVYMGMFPDDYEIPVWKLIRLWVAEGLIRNRGDVLDLENIAEEYLEELVYRNVVMVGKRRSNDKIKTCILHDTLREFCKKQGAQEKLFIEIKKNSPNPVNYRRLCINNVNVAEFIASPPQGRCVRSLLTFTREEMNVDPQHVSTIPKTFKLLRVLEIQKLKLQRFPNEMNHLILLKYIAISSKFASLPKTMSSLWSLQTLIANTDASVLRIEADIWQLPQFRHLHTNTSTILPPLDSKTIQKRENVRVQDIQTLSTIAPESCTKETFERSPKLKKLGIRGKLAQLFEGNNESSIFRNLNMLGSLEILRLVNDDANSKLSGLPSDNIFPKQLTKLTLSGTRLDWQEMHKLGMLENLEILKLKDHAFEGKKWQVKPNGFKELKHLHIGTTELEEWEASASDFPKLKCLEVYFCYELKAIPDEFAEISSLQSVFLHCTNKEVASSASRLQAKAGEKATKFKLSVYPPIHVKDNGEE